MSIYKKKKTFSDEERLAHKCLKETQRELKKIRAFEIQRYVKKLRNLKDEEAKADTTNDTDGVIGETDDVQDKRKEYHEKDSMSRGNEKQKGKLKAKIRNAEREVFLVKAVCLEELARKAVRSIGLDQYLAQKLSTVHQQGAQQRPTDRKSESKDKSESEKETKDLDRHLLEGIEKRLLHSPRLKKLLKEFDERATSLRRIALLKEEGADEQVIKRELKRGRKRQREDNQEADNQGEPHKDRDWKKKKNRKSNKKNEGKVEMGDIEKAARKGFVDTNSFFVSSLSGQMDEEDEEDLNRLHYGRGQSNMVMADDLDEFDRVKKNRPGQRQRKLRAQAREARAAGKKWSGSWRKREEDVGDGGAQSDQSMQTTGKFSSKGESKGRDRGGEGPYDATKHKKTMSRGQSGRGGGGGDKKADGDAAHPSWIAKKAQKEQQKIVIDRLPKAKKIVFDD